MNRWAKYTLAPVLMAVMPNLLAAQQNAAQPPVKGMASTVGLYVYPQKSQSATQQLTDEQQCQQREDADWLRPKCHNDSSEIQ